jgi:hypothetical protein
MIKNISSMGKYVEVNHSVSSIYSGNHSGAQGVGNLRFNTNTQSMEVYDGNMWLTLNMNHCRVGLTHHAEALLDWAEKKMREELELEALAESNSTIKDLLDTVKQKQEQISIVKTLLKDSEVKI